MRWFVEKFDVLVKDFCCLGRAVVGWVWGGLGSGAADGFFLFFSVQAN